MPPEFWESCHNHDVIIHFSDYPIKLPIQELQEKAKNAGVSLGAFSEGLKRPKDTGQNRQDSPQPPHDQNKAWSKRSFSLDPIYNAQESFMRCGPHSACNSIKNGKYYRCVAIAKIGYFNSYFQKNIPVTEKDYVDIYAIQDIRELLKYINNPSPMCRYCDAGAALPAVWGISKKSIDEWV